MNLEEGIKDAVAKKLEDGTIEKLIEAQLTNGIDSALGDLFGYCGSVQKVIKQKIEEVMVPQIERHNFNNYLTKLDTVLSEIVNRTSLTCNKKILDNFQSLMTETDMKEIKITDIFKKWCDHVADDVETSGLETNCEDGNPCYETVSVEINVDIADKGYLSSYENATVSFLCEHDEDMNFAFRIYKNKEKEKWNLFGYDRDCNVGSLRNLNDFDIFMMKLAREFITIELDSKYESDEIELTVKPEWDLN